MLLFFYSFKKFFSRGFFTQSTKNVAEEKKKDVSVDSGSALLNEKKTEKPKEPVKRARKASISPKSEKNQIKKNVKKVVESSSDESVIEEKENSGDSSVSKSVTVSKSNKCL